MGKNNKLQFNCEKCGSNELAYQKYVKCITPISLSEGSHVEYLPSATDEDDYLATLNGYACRSCGHLVEHCGCVIVTEKELKQLSTMDPETRAKEQREYDVLIEAQINEQEQRENEHIVYHEEISAAEKLAQAD